MAKIRVIEKSGNFPGKNAVILAGVHGNEKCGIGAIEEIIDKLNIDSGKVTFIFANLEAIRQDKRFIDFDLNRCFLRKQPEKIAKSIEGQVAKKIMPYLEDADYMLDLHSSNSPDSIPFAICGEQSLDVARALPVEIVSYNWDDFEPGSTDYYMNLQDKIGICVECGYTKDPLSKLRAIEAIKSFLLYCGATRKPYFKIKSLYKNKNEKFVKSREFSDFEVLKEKELVGMDGNEEIYGKKGDVLLFVRDGDNLEEECFLVAEETLLNSDELNRLKEDRK